MSRSEMLNDTLLRIYEWAESKDFDMIGQINKVEEEVSEVRQQWPTDGTDKEIADVIIATVVMGQVYGLGIDELITAIQEKTDTVVNRNGKTIDGQFVKESDLDEY